MLLEPYPIKAISLFWMSWYVRTSRQMLLPCLLKPDFETLQFTLCTYHLLWLFEVCTCQRRLCLFFLTFECPTIGRFQHRAWLVSVRRASLWFRKPISLPWSFDAVLFFFSPLCCWLVRLSFVFFSWIFLANHLASWDLAYMPIASSMENKIKMGPPHVPWVISYTETQ